MIRLRQIIWTSLACWCLFFGPATDARAHEEAPSIQTMLTNIMTRMSCVQTQGFRGKYSYTKVKAQEELSSKGTVKEKDEKMYAVYPIYGRPFSKLVQSDGKPLAYPERRKEEEREVTTRQRWEEVKSEPYVSKKDLPLTLEILNRFDFKVQGRDTLNGRPVWVLTFKPRGNDLPENKIQDRVVNKMGGTVWVDAEEFEIAKADLHLIENVSLVGGIVGTLRRLNYQLERKRVDEGVWFTAKSEADIEGRQVVVSRHVKLREECTDFKKVESPAGGAQ
jgi:hypothetical protein